MTDITSQAFTTFAKLIGEEYINNLPDDYKNLKKFLHNTNVYGTSEYPLFIAREIQNTIGKSDHFRLRDFSNDILTMYQEKIMKHRGQKRKILFITDHGMYQVLSMYKGEDAEQFRCFVSLAMKNLYLHKQTSLSEITEQANYHSENKEEISQKYIYEIDKLKKKIENLRGELHEDQLEYNDLTDTIDSLNDNVDDLNWTNDQQRKNIATLTKNIGKVKDSYDRFNPPVFKKLNQMKILYWDKLYVYLLPCKACDDEHNQLNLNYDSQSYNSDNVIEDEAMLYVIHKESDNKTFKSIDASVILTVYVPKPLDISITHIKKYIKEIINPKIYKFKNMTVYYSSLDVIKNAFETIENIVLSRKDWMNIWPQIKKINYNPESTWIQ